MKHGGRVFLFECVLNIHVKSKKKKVCALSAALSTASAGLEDPLREENCQLTHINGCDFKHISIHRTHFALCGGGEKRT